MQSVLLFNKNTYIDQFHGNNFTFVLKKQMQFTVNTYMHINNKIEIAKETERKQKLMQVLNTAIFFSQVLLFSFFPSFIET